MDRFFSRRKTTHTTPKKQSAPVFHLPLELLQDIFILSLPYYPNSDPITAQDFEQNFDAINPPWTICRVCRQWRFVCLSFPQLWNRFEVAPPRENVKPSHDERVGGHRSRMLERRIELARGEKLFVVLRQYPSTPNDVSLTKLFNLVFNVSNQVASLELDLEHATHPSMIHLYQQLSRTPDAFRSLHTLAFHLYKPRPTNHTPILVFRDAPLLTSLSIKSHFRGLTAHQEELSRWFLPWGRLTSLQLDSIPWNNVITILHSTPNLQHLMLTKISRFYWSTAEDLVRPETVTLPVLNSLRFSNENQGESVLSFLAAPSLAELYTESPKNPSHFLRMFSTLPCITKWTWVHEDRDQRSRDEDITALFHAISTSLEEFVFHMKCPYVSLSRLLMAIPSLTRLRRLEIRGLNLSQDRRLVSTLLRSLGGLEQLESVSIWFDVQDKNSQKLWTELCTELYGLQLGNASLGLWGQCHGDIVCKQC